MVMPASRYLEGFGSTPEPGFGPGEWGSLAAARGGADMDPLFFANEDDRGGVRGSDRSSFGTNEAGAQITRTNLHWGGTVGQPLIISFAFRSTVPTSTPFNVGEFTRFSDSQIAATLLALASWSDVANISFQRVNGPAGVEAYSDDASILFANYRGPTSGYGFGMAPGSRENASSAGDIWTNAFYTPNQTVVSQSFTQFTLTSTIGTALGLERPGNYVPPTGFSNPPNYAAGAAYNEDTQQYSIMSYFSATSSGADFGGRYSAVPLLDDIAAVQRLYGANMSTRTGDTVYGFNSNAGRPWFNISSGTDAPIFALWDAGGNDTLDFSGYTVAQTIDLRQGAFSNVGGLTGNVAIALGAVIENAVGGSGNDRLVGNSADNLLTGNAGNDSVDGGLGSDTAVFNRPRDEYTVTVVGQTVTVSHATDGTDTLVNVEFLRFSDQTLEAGTSGALTLGGDVLDNLITGTSFDDILSGLGGNDTLSGLDGNDRLSGGNGDDTISGGDGDDHVSGGFGNDTLSGGAGHDVADYSAARGSVQVSLATGFATGAEGNDTLSGFEEIRGGSANDILTGDDRANTVHGRGGVDVLIGGGGNDTLVAGQPGIANIHPDIIKTRQTANSTIATAVDTVGSYDLQTRTGVDTGAGIPHTTILGESHGGMEFYAVTVAAGDVVVFDIDDASFDSVLRLFDANGTELAQNNNGSTGFFDRPQSSDSVISHTFATAGTYYIQVSAWVANGSGGTFTSGPAPIGGTYQLNISVPSAPAAPPVERGSTLDGGAGDDSLRGGAGIDTLIGGSGSDLIDGDFGFDTALYSGVRRQYGVSAADGPVTPNVTRSTVSGGPEGGTDTLVSIEEARFVDGVLSFDVNGIPAQVMRLYDATLDRQPDQAGLDLYVQAMASGSRTLVALASILVDSPEFQARYGALSNQQFVEQLYRFSLDRAGDPQGIAHYVNALNAGTSRAAVVVIFSESPEHRILTQPILNAGLWVADQKAVAIARLYDAAFDRLPDAAGLASYVAAVNTGTTLQDIAAVFVASPEFQSRYGPLTNQAFVEQLYRFCLDREGDAAGIAGYVAALDAGASRAVLLVHFSESPEHVALTAPLWLGGVPTIDPAFSGAVAESSGPKVLDDQPLVLSPADDPAGVMIGFKVEDDAFVLPPRDAPEPWVLPDVEGGDGLLMPFDGFAMRTDNWMVTLPVHDDNALPDVTPWHRTAGDDGWMLH